MQCTRIPANISTRATATRRNAVITASAASSSGRAPEVARRQLLSVAGISVASALLPAQAPAFTVSDTTELCAYQSSVEKSEECRRRALGSGSNEAYGAASGRNKDRERSDIVTGVPVAELNSEYVTATRTVIADIEAYLTLDVYSKERIVLIKRMKAECIDWVSKYARGGSARTDSARRAYIAVDAVVGFLASNGLAPFPAGKAKTVLTTTAQALEFLEKGK